MYPLKNIYKYTFEIPPSLRLSPPSPKQRAGGVVKRANRVPGAKAPVQVSPRKNRNKMERQKLVPMNWDELQAAVMEERKNPIWENRWHAARAWLMYGGKVSLDRWVRRDDRETYLRLKDGKVVLVHWDGTWQPFCTLDGLSKWDTYVMIPYDLTGFEKMHRGRLKKSV